MKMVTSSAWLLPVLACVCVVNFEITLADVKACSIARYGTLTMFNGEKAEVKLPCKYRLADFTCGDYRVKVTPDSAVDTDYSHRFSPDTVWVKVVNTRTGEFVKIRTSVERLDKFSEGNKTNPWQVKNGSVSVVDFADYEQAAAVLRKDGVFSVEFSSAERSVVVTCSDDEFVSQGLPEALCGDGTTTDVMHKAITTLFPVQDDVTDDALVAYVVLNHDNVVQSPTCKDLASKSTSCQDKEQAAMECAAIFGDQAECLAGSDTSLRDYYAGCLTSVCDNVTSALEPMNNYIREHCVPWLERSCDSDANCTDSIHAECFKGKCLCTLGYYYSNGQDVCVDNCPVPDQQAEFLTYPGIYLSGYGYAVHVYDANNGIHDNLVDCLAVCAKDANCFVAEFDFDEMECTRNYVSSLSDINSLISEDPDMSMYQQRCT
ncbi:uncharacterized protein [Littorina saxatilis]|uniref:uncharacterized protein n=1 Tax=Littorina saxatilis TaxID=31220 RepID=UPI0038B4D73D